MPGAHRPYTWGLRIVCPVLERHLHKDRKAATALHPVLSMNKVVKPKRWSRWKGQKIYRKGILKNKKHSPEKRCYIFFWNLHSFPLKPVTSFLERCYVLFWKVLCLFEKDATSFQAGRRYLGWLPLIIEKVTSEWNGSFSCNFFGSFIKRGAKRVERYFSVPVASLPVLYSKYRIGSIHNFV